MLGEKHYDAKELKEGRVPPGRAVAGRLQAGRLPARGRRGAGEEGLPPAGPPGHRELQRTLHKAIFDVHGPMPTKGRLDTARFALGAVFVYQLALLHRYDVQGSKTNRGLKAFLRAA